MDLGFFRRAEMRFASRSAARLDYDVLIASLDAHQSASVTAKAVRNAAATRAAALGPHPIAELILGGPAWREAIEAQGGSFSGALARQNEKGA